ncbi:MAG: alpha/beta hydrolase, partial [Planctomycetota bacterium]
MPSIRARLVNQYVRSTLKRLPLHEIEPVKLRRIIERKPIPGTAPRGVDREVVSVPVKGEWHRPAGRSVKRVILYFHGGGYVFGSPTTHRTLTYPLALTADAEVFSLDYRLAPEHPCPAAIEDALAAYQWLRVIGRAPEDIVFAGDSAGGGLALAAMQALVAAGEPLPACAVLYSPYTDLTAEAASLDANAESDDMFQRASFSMGPNYYAANMARNDPRASPLFGDMRGLPPLLVFASTSEMLYDDSARLVR